MKEQFWLVTWLVEGNSRVTEAIDEHPVDAIIGWHAVRGDRELALLFAMPIEKAQFEKMSLS